VCGGGSLCWSVQVCPLLGERRVGGVLLAVGLYEGVKDCIRKYGLVVV